MTPPTSAMPAIGGADTSGGGVDYRCVRVGGHRSLRRCWRLVAVSTAAMGSCGRTPQVWPGAGRRRVRALGLSALPFLILMYSTNCIRWDCARARCTTQQRKRTSREACDPSDTRAVNAAAKRSDPPPLSYACSRRCHCPSARGACSCPAPNTYAQPPTAASNSSGARIRTRWRSAWHNKRGVCCTINLNGG